MQVSALGERAWWERSVLVLGFMGFITVYGRCRGASASRKGLNFRCENSGAFPNM